MFAPPALTTSPKLAVDSKQKLMQTRMGVAMVVRLRDHFTVVAYRNPCPVAARVGATTADIKFQHQAFSR